MRLNGARQRKPEQAWRREKDALLRARIFHYRGDRRVTGIWRDRFGRRGNRENFVLRFPGALCRDPDRSCLARQDRLEALKEFGTYPFTLTHLSFRRPEMPAGLRNPPSF